MRSPAAELPQQHLPEPGTAPLEVPFSPLLLKLSLQSLHRQVYSNMGSDYCSYQVTLGRKSRDEITILLYSSPLFFFLLSFFAYSLKKNKNKKLLNGEDVFALCPRFSGHFAKGREGKTLLPAPVSNRDVSLHCKANSWNWNPFSDMGTSCNGLDLLNCLF